MSSYFMIIYLYVHFVCSNIKNHDHSRTHASNFLIRTRMWRCVNIFITITSAIILIVITISLDEREKHRKRPYNCKHVGWWSKVGFELNESSRNNQAGAPKFSFYIFSRSINFVCLHDICKIKNDARIKINFNNN